jgi:hypothetical protein
MSSWLLSSGLNKYMPIEFEMKCKIFEIKLASNICKQSMGKKIKVVGSSCKENDARS